MMYRQSVDIKTIAQSLKRSEGAIIHKLKKIDVKIRSHKELRAKGSRSYDKWTLEEEEKLLSEYDDGYSLIKIARIHRRGVREY